MIKYCYIDDLGHPLAKCWNITRDLDQDLTIPLESVIIITGGDLELINQIHTAWRSNDLLVIVLGNTDEYYRMPDCSRQIRQTNLIRSLHYQHAHQGVVGPWLVHLRVSECVSTEYIYDTINWLAENRYRCRVQDMVMALNTVPNPNKSS